MRLTDPELMLHIQRRLGVPIRVPGLDHLSMISPAHRCVPGCKAYGPDVLPKIPGPHTVTGEYHTAEMHQIGAHSLGCHHNSTRHQRHNHANSAFLETLSAANAGVVDGEVGVATADGKRGDGVVSHPALGQGGNYVIDTTVVPSARTSILHKTARVEDAVLIEGERTKHAKYDAICKQSGFEGFLAIAVNGQGGIGPEGRRVIDTVWTHDKHASRGIAKREQIARTNKRRRKLCQFSVRLARAFYRCVATHNRLPRRGPYKRTKLQGVAHTLVQLAKNRSAKDNHCNLTRATTCSVFVGNTLSDWWATNSHKHPSTRVGPPPDFSHTEATPGAPRPTEPATINSYATPPN